MNDALLTLGEAAHILGYSPRAMRTLIYRSKRRAAGLPVKGPTIQFFQPGPRAAIHFHQEWLTDFIKHHTVNPTATPLVERVPRLPAPTTPPSKPDLGPRLPGFPKFLDDL
jgi:hypothetical protein